MRQEHPRPQLIRNSWVNLNGEWEFEYDDQEAGEEEKWYNSHNFSKTIQVPFCFQSRLSGIGETDFHDVVWYRKKINIPNDFEKKKINLHFGAVDYQAWVWVNGQFVTYHEGGHVPFQIEITNLLEKENNQIVVKAKDSSTDLTIPRGKQFWKERSEGIFYTRTTGIWQTVWLEAVANTYIEQVRYTADYDQNNIQIETSIRGLKKNGNTSLKVTITMKDKHITDEYIQVKHETETRSIQIAQINSMNKSEYTWSPENPNLFEVEMTLFDNGNEIDKISSYFGMRKITVDDGKIYLNNQPYVLKMVLDQGYFPEGILTAPTDAAIRKDVELTKAMGFNGARKHQKVEDPRYLYWCDRLGLMVWGEMANAYDFSEQYVDRITTEWKAVIQRDYNHPCIIAWVPLNESWGVPNIIVNKQQQDHAVSMYYLTKSLDQTRLVITNDGWEQVKADLLTRHDYNSKREVLEDRYRSLESVLKVVPIKKKLYVGGYEYEGQPIMVTECGGISFKKDNTEGWGYSGADNEEDYLKKLRDVIEPLLNSPVVRGFCYTQLTDVEQEINGLLTYDRKPKVPLEKIRDIIDFKIIKRSLHTNDK